MANKAAHETKFDFITDEQFRTILESDYSELMACKRAGAWKAVHVLAGSIVEAVLIDHLIGQKIVGAKSALKLDLGKAIDRCLTAKIISPSSSELSTVIKSYRNLIHPGRHVRVHEDVDEDTAIVSESVVRIILREVAETRRKTYGFTGEQVISKLERDPTAGAIVKHILDEVDSRERQRLLLELLPSQYFAAWESGEGPPHLFEALRSCYRTAFELESDTVRRRVGREYVRILKEGSGGAIQTRFTPFFKSSDLRYVAEKAVKLIKEHLLSRLRTDLSGELVDCFDGIGTFIRAEDVPKYVDSVVTVVIGPTSHAERMRLRMIAEHPGTPWETQQEIRDRLGSWVEHLFEGERYEDAEKVVGLRDEYELPF